MRVYPLFFVLFIGVIFPQGRDTTGVFKTRLVQKDTVNAAFTGNSTGVADSLASKKIIKRDTLKPVNQQPLNQNSFFINKNYIVRTNYKTVHDAAENYPLSFIKDYGFAVHPGDLYINGAGVNSTAYLFDGVESNSDMSWFNPLYIQTENIDSVEIISSARSFLYGINGSAAGMNILTKNRVDWAPFTRLRYHEGPFREGTLDAQYSSIVFSRFVLSFDFTSKKVEDVTRKWNSSLWLGNLKLKYFPTDKMNIIASYDYRNYKLSLTGGVDVTALDTLPRDANKTFEETVYNTNTGLLVDNYSYNKQSYQGVSLKALSSYVDNGYTDLALYYRAALDEYRQNESNEASINDRIPKCVVDIRTKTLGAKLRQTYGLGIFNIDASADYKITKYDTNRVILSNWKSSYSVGGKLSAAPFEATEISVFAKSAYHNGYLLNGAGADVTIGLNKRISFYFGVSTFNNVRRDHSNDTGFINYYLGYYNAAQKISTNLIEGGVKYSDGFVSLNAKVIYRKENSEYDYFGAGAGVTLRYWKLLIENTTSYNDRPYADNLNYDNYVGPMYFLTGDILPRFQISTGFYYKDILFDSNLDLKAGLSTRFTNFKRQPNTYYYNLFKQNIFTLNFELSGEIQKTAILYFTWENLFDTKYFVVPYYPMPQRIIRFGISWNFLN